MDLKQHLLRQMAWSHATFGPGQRLEGLLDHLRKELVEVEESNGSPEEWVDVVILALDGLTRSIIFTDSIDHRADPEFSSQQACTLIKVKQSRNEAREWPDFRVADKNKAIEHVKK